MSRDRRPPRPATDAGRGAPLDPGLVVASHGRHVLVETPEGARVLCHPRGKKSEAVVGDHVRWQRSGDEGVIEAIDERRNRLYRQDEWRTKSFAANVDQLLLVVAADPPFSESQLSRALIAAAAAAIPSLIVLNKTDLPAAAAARERLQPYRRMGAELVEAAFKAAPEATLTQLRPRLDGRVTLILGPSGAGKSTLINLLVPGARAATGEVSVALASGRHTTTTTTWYWLDGPGRGAVIDSPGFQEFGLRHLEPQQLASLMPDLAVELGHCRFHNCSHREEPQCGLRAAVDSGRIGATRWRIYQELYAELSQPRW